MMRIHQSAVALLVLLFGVACVDAPADDMCEVDPSYQFADGIAWGPCLPDDSCTQGNCYKTAQGSVCALRRSQSVGCPDHPHCAETSGTGLAMGANVVLVCVQTCDHDIDCTAGMVCTSASECVWPDDDGTGE